MEKQTPEKDGAMMGQARSGEKPSSGGNGKDSTPPNVIDVSEDEFKKAAGADPDSEIEVISNEEMAKIEAEKNRRLGDLLSGKEKPANEFVSYLVEQLRAGNAEYRQVELTIQEINQRLGTLQKRAIQLQGEQGKYAKDILRWMDRDLNKSTGDEPGKESDDG